MQVAKNCDVVFVSVKPQYVHTVLTEARPVLKEDTLVISIAAGITVAQLLEAAGPNARVCRVMPNTPCLVGETAAAMCLGGKVRQEGLGLQYKAAGMSVITSIDKHRCMCVAALPAMCLGGKVRLIFCICSTAGMLTEIIPPVACRQASNASCYDVYDHTQRCMRLAASQRRLGHNSKCMQV